MSLQLDRRSEELRLRVVRRPLRHDSSPKHVAGSAAFVDDMREPEGLLHVAVGGAQVASGQLLGINLDAVRAAPGVVAVLTAADIPGKNDVGPVLHDDPIFIDGRIDFRGQVAFAVVAQTREQARRAAKLGKVEASVGTHCVSVDDALAADSHILPDYTFRKDDSTAALTESAYRVKGRLRIGGQEHFYLEGQVSLAIPGEDGDMLIHTSTQHPSEMQHLVAGMLKVPVSAVTVEVRRMGGAFGGKETQAAQWAAIAALGAHVTGRPCKIRLDRDDDMCLTGKRHDFLSDYEIGFDVDGRIQSLETVMASRCGYSADVSGAINDRAMFHADNAYYLPAATITTKRMKTNTVSNTAFRGFGGPQGMMVAERAIDEIAWALGVDPLDVRKRNLYREGHDVTPYGMFVEDNILPALIDRCEATSDYRARRRKIAAFNAESTTLKRGIALTPVKFGISFTTTHLNQAGALVHVYQDGSIHLNHGGTEMGQGLYVKVAQVVAEEFGVDLDKVKITATTTAKVPNTSATAASSGSDINGWAAKNAAGAIKERLVAFAAESYEVSSDQIEFRDSRVFIGNQSLPFAELIRKAYMARVSLSSTGFYKTPKIHWDAAKGKGRPFFYFSYGAACSEVLVDVTTGEMKVTRVDILHDVGRSLNPAVDIGQIEGGFVQGMGWLTTEELVFHPDGRLLTHAPSTYKIPCASDTPEHFEIALWDGANREDSIHRSKAVGEPPLMLAISVFAAVADAIHSLNPAVPVPLDAPATPRVDFARRAGGDDLMSTWPTIARFIAEHGAAALVTLAQAHGSSPREVGARMVVAPNGTFTGTIGGGALEWGALAEAQALLARRDGTMIARLDKALGPDLGQCCGGRVLLTIERFGAADEAAITPPAEAERAGVLTTIATVGADGRLSRRIAQANEGRAPRPAYEVQSDGRVYERFGDEPTPFYLFGAGHVGRALSVALSPLPFLITWIDARPGAIPETFPVNVTAVTQGDPVALLGRAPDGAFVSVMTHSHALDLDLVIAALQANRFPYVGLIGSATKRARFTSAMQKMGMAPDAVGRLVCPIGLTTIKDKAPAAIAASVAAQVLMAREAVLNAGKVSEPRPGRARHG